MAASPSITHFTSVMRGTAGAKRPLVTRCRVADLKATGTPGGAGARVRPTVIPSIGCTCGSCMGLQIYYIGKTPPEKATQLSVLQPLRSAHSQHVDTSMADPIFRGE